MAPKSKCNRNPLELRSLELIVNCVCAVLFFFFFQRCGRCRLRRYHGGHALLDPYITMAFKSKCNLNPPGVERIVYCVCAVCVLQRGGRRRL